jgi:hypothetical protein
MSPPMPLVWIAIIDLWLRGLTVRAIRHKPCEANIAILVPTAWAHHQPPPLLKALRILS